MYLLINTSKPEFIQIAVFDLRNFTEKKFTIRRSVLMLVERLLKSKKLKLSDVEGVMCVVGSGSFTATRIAVVTANTLAYSLKIPVLAITSDEVEHVQKLIPKLHKQPIEQYILPTYSGEPNVGLLIPTKSGCGVP